MTRPMPGPPEHCYCRDGDQPCRSCLDDGGFYPGGVCPGCYLHNGDRGPRETRLTDTECEREWEAFEQDASTALLLHTLGDKRVPAWRFKRFNHGANTWRRFATHPHALEEA